MSFSGFILPAIQANLQQKRMPVFTDQLARSVNLPKTPQRIISLVPSQTELLYSFGLEEEVIGITRFCIHPHKWFKSKTRVGGTKQVHMETIRQLQPDLIIANKEENAREQIEALARDFPIWISDVNNLNDALKMIGTIGQIVDKETEAGMLIDKIQTAFTQLPVTSYQPRTCYFIWREPYMTIGGDTFINDMLQHAGFNNVFSNKLRYPEITIAELQNLNCELLLLSSEPYPFKEKHIHKLQPYLPNTKIILTDGELFSWYGSRLQYAPEYFMQLRKQVTA